MAPDPHGWPGELHDIEQLRPAAGSLLEHRVACHVALGETELPVHVFTLGNPAPEVPAIGFFGGVHGLERIGVAVVTTFLRQVLHRLAWDLLLQHQLEQLRMVFMPLVNPGGLLLGTRANPRGVDLMRNAPVDCDSGAPPLLGGQRLSASLPWYRGAAGQPMERESQALCDVVRRELLGHGFSLAIDCHSGFGLSDRLWFPLAHTRRPVEHLPELHALAALLDDGLPHHPYLFEPQSRQYLAHGDLWDHLYLTAQADDRAPVLLPLTLEMGSWLWVKKNPRQFFSRHGLFNPLLAHRQQRVLRRHLQLLDFLSRAAFSHAQWRPPPKRTAQPNANGRWTAGTGACAGTRRRDAAAQPGCAGAHPCGAPGSAMLEQLRSTCMRAVGAPGRLSSQFCWHCQAAAAAKPHPAGSTHGKPSIEPS